MIALDTCVFARWVMRDHPEQTKIADSLLAQPFYLGIGVLIELGWVLQSVGGMSRADLARALAALLGLPTACVQNEAHVRWAVERFAAQGDLADMLHIANSTEAEALATFDAKMVRQAGPNAPVPMRLLP
jgi:predicted nucleic-acid-binding protein